MLCTVTCMAHPIILQCLQYKKPPKKMLVSWKYFVILYWKAGDICKNTKIPAVVTFFHAFSSRKGLMCVRLYPSASAGGCSSSKIISLAVSNIFDEIALLIGNPKTFKLFPNQICKMQTYRCE